MTDPFELAERVATAARALNVESALIGASTLAIHGYVRGTSDIDFASAATALRSRHGERASASAG